MKARSLYFCLPLLIASEASAEPKLRAELEQRGDFALIGNTLGHDCRALIPAPALGSVGDCGSDTGDSSPDVFWRDGIAERTTAIAEARSTAVLGLPDGARVSHAWLYWAARRSGTAADTDVTFERPGEFAESVSAIESFMLSAGEADVHYQSVADVSALVQAAGSGIYRVGAVDSLSLPELDQEVAFSGWYLVVLYELASEPWRHLALFDGLDRVDRDTQQSLEISGFLPPHSNFDAKLGVVSFDGDLDISGDSLSFGGVPLSDAANPSENFFNSTRSWRGSAAPRAGDLPELVGTSGSLSGLDLDVVDVGAKLHAGQASARIDAVSSADVVLLGAFVTSIATVPSNFASQDGALTGGGCACAATDSGVGHRLWLAIGVLSAALTRRRKRDA